MDAIAGLLLVLAAPGSSALCQSVPSSLKITHASGPQYARSIRTADGTVYLLGCLKSTDAGNSLVRVEPSDPRLGTLLRENAMNTVFTRKNLFLALYSKVVCAADGQCTGKVWRSSDDLKSIQENDTRVIIPEAGVVDNAQPGEWTGVFFHRAIVELRDGSLLAAMYGSFESDRTVPTNPRSKEETKYKLRAFVVRSTDQGTTWRYLSTVVVPDPGAVDDSEGFNEWTIARLADGRLFGVIRTGHYTPMVVTWSSDEGKSWTRPITPAGLGPGGDPFLLPLSDGRLALAYGEIVQPAGTREEYFAHYRERADYRRRCVLAINADGSGRSWVAHTVANYAIRSAYSTIFQVEPATIVYQSDLDLWRVELPPR